MVFRVDRLGLSVHILRAEIRSRFEQQETLSMARWLGAFLTWFLIFMLSTPTAVACPWFRRSYSARAVVVYRSCLPERQPAWTINSFPCGTEAVGPASSSLVKPSTSDSAESQAAPAPPVLQRVPSVRQGAEPKRLPAAENQLLPPPRKSVESVASPGVLSRPIPPQDATRLVPKKAAVTPGGEPLETLPDGPSDQREPAKGVSEAPKSVELRRREPTPPPVESKEQDLSDVPDDLFDIPMDKPAPALRPNDRGSGPEDGLEDDESIDSLFDDTEEPSKGDRSSHLGTSESISQRQPSGHGAWASRIPAPGGLNSLELRRWIDSTGRFSCHGRLIRVGERTVQLLKRNGRTSTILWHRLSDRDRQFIADQVQPAGTRMVVGRTSRF